MHHPAQTSQTGKGEFRGPTIRQPIDGDLQARVMEGLLRSWGLSIDATPTGNQWLPEREGGRLRRGGWGGSGDAGATTGDAGSGDPAYREAAAGGRWAPAARGRLARRSSPTLKAASRRQPYLGGGNRVISPSKPA